jgi:hypothetical protein
MRAASRLNAFVQPGGTRSRRPAPSCVTTARRRRGGCWPRLSKAGRHADPFSVAGWPDALCSARRGSPRGGSGAWAWADWARSAGGSFVSMRYSRALYPTSAATGSQAPAPLRLSTRTVTVAPAAAVVNASSPNSDSCAVRGSAPRLDVVVTEEEPGPVRVSWIRYTGAGTPAAARAMRSAPAMAAVARGARGLRGSDAGQAGEGS